MPEHTRDCGCLEQIAVVLHLPDQALLTVDQVHRQIELGHATLHRQERPRHLP